MALYNTANEALVALDGLSSFEGEELKLKLRELASQVSADAPGDLTLLYSGKLPNRDVVDVACMQRSGIQGKSNIRLCF